MKSPAMKSMGGAALYTFLCAATILCAAIKPTDYTIISLILLTYSEGSAAADAFDPRTASAQLFL